MVDADADTVDPAAKGNTPPKTANKARSVKRKVAAPIANNQNLWLVIGVIAAVVFSLLALIVAGYFLVAGGGRRSENKFEGNQVQHVVGGTVGRPRHNPTPLAFDPRAEPARAT